AGPSGAASSGPAPSPRSSRPRLRNRHAWRAALRTRTRCGRARRWTGGGGGSRGGGRARTSSPSPGGGPARASTAARSRCRRRSSGCCYSPEPSPPRTHKCRYLCGEKQPPADHQGRGAPSPRAFEAQGEEGHREGKRRRRPDLCGERHPQVHRAHELPPPRLPPRPICP
uniref:Uncharacterized protein n=1 Tax=Triticum urartu TaxID=4572 RepID=A0A8R7UIB7_TRIUA